MEKFKQCKICNEIHNYQSGDFTLHLQDKHDTTREQYIISTEYDNQTPKCQCGFCKDDAIFISRKNSFYKINPDHRSFEWLEQKFIEKYGQPKCKACGNDVKFHRGKPNTYCSLSCKPSSWNQETIKKTVMTRYGVDNVMEIESVKKKVADKSKESWKSNKEKNIKKSRATKKERYGDENYVNKEKKKITCLEKFGFDSYSKTLKFRDMSSKTAIKTNAENPITVKPYKNTELYYQGTYEFRFLEYCEKLDLLKFIKRSKSFYYLEEDKEIGQRHLPDFLFKDKYIIEIKSTYILNKQGGQKVIDAKKRSVEKNGYQYILVLDNNFNIFSKIK